MHAGTSTVENSAQGPSCQLKFVHGLLYKKRNVPNCIIEINGTAPFKNVNIWLNTNIHSNLKISSGQSSNLYLNVVHFLNTGVNKTSVAA